MTHRPDLELRRLQAQAMLDFSHVRHKAERFLERQFEREGLSRITPTQANALMVLVTAKEPLTARRLADEMGLSEVTVGRFVRALEGGGWVVRTRDPNDSRAIRISATPQTLDALPRFVRASNALFDAAFATFDAQRIADFAHCTAEIRAAIDAPDVSPAETDPVG